MHQVAARPSEKVVIAPPCYDEKSGCRRRLSKVIIIFSILPNNDFPTVSLI